MRCIEIENKSYFYRLIDSLNKVSKGEVLDELSLDEMKQYNIILILDYLNLSENFKRVSNDIQKLIKEKIDEVDYDELNRRYKKVINIWKRVISKIEIPISVVEDIDIDKLIKVLNVRINFSDNLLNNLLLLIDINGELGNEKVLVFVNLKQYLTKEELQELYKYSIYNQQIIMLIDSQSYGVSNKNEKKILIDDTLEEYML
ncbi:MAG: type II-A CRISPR-associated protein Csn2 [Bacilli bacterium]|nr:type II-A CRISPR-associated protein Csn2 [Bacilli bacterium]